MVRGNPEVRFHEGSTTKKSTACCWGYHLSLFGGGPSSFPLLGYILLGCLDFNFLQTNGFSTKPLHGKPLATEFRFPFTTEPRPPQCCGEHDLPRPLALLGLMAWCYPPTVDGCEIHLAPAGNHGNRSLLVLTLGNQIIPWFLAGCRISSIHSRCLRFLGVW